MSNPLTNFLPDRIRIWVYLAYALVGLGLGAVPVYCGATATETPVWVVGALAVYAFLGGPLFGATAASNVPKPTYRLD